LHQFLELEGKRYSHIVDPGTGLGLTSHIACTVIGPDATTSDAMATAMCVLGVDKGLKKAEDLKSLQVRFATLANDIPMMKTSTAFPAMGD
jgi:thiamine biosynthesis lipoprotein